jgi:NADH-quinone oxidoreductase subunit E
MNIDISRIDDILMKYQGKRGALIPLLQNVQDIYGYLPKEALIEISKRLKVTMSDIYGVATFYTQFRLSPTGKYIIKVCHGTACHVGGANILDEMFKNKLGISFNETTSDGLFTILSVACLGCCSLAPVVMINDETYGKLTGEKFSRIIDDYISKSS